MPQPQNQRYQYWIPSSHLDCLWEVGDLLPGVPVLSFQSGAMIIDLHTFHNVSARNNLNQPRLPEIVGCCTVAYHGLQVF